MSEPRKSITLSELIIKLNSMLVEYGDIPVMDNDGTWGPSPVPVNGVYVSVIPYIKVDTQREVISGPCLIIDLHGNKPGFILA